MSITVIEDLDTFHREIISNGGTSLVQFKAEWCSPCKAMQPIIEEVAKTNPEVKFFAVDVEGDGIDEVLSDYEVRSVPAFVKIEAGNKTGLAVGVQKKSELDEFVRG